MNIATLAVSLAGTLVQPSPPRDEHVAWLRERAIAFDGVEAGAPLDDLVGFGKMVGDARIVALGESTHGSREIFQMKHRLLEYLVLEKGFTIFSIEASMPESYVVGEYVRGGEGDVEGVIRGMGFWTWTTEEVREMVEWMRRTNAKGEHRIEFTGFDMQNPSSAMGEVVEFLREIGDESANDVEATYARAMGAMHGGSMEWTSFTGAFPIELAAGKVVRFSGMIRTEGKGCWASLWWRADLNGQPVAFDNGQEQAPRGDTGWKRFSITVDVPEEIDNINMGMIFAGEGTAWFDDLRIEIDGEAIEAAGLDLGFESGELLGFGQGVAGFEGVIVGDGAVQGDRCLRVSKEKRPAGAVIAAEVLPEVREVRRQLEARRDRLVEKCTPKEADWAIQNARIAEQAMGLRGDDARTNRDHAMAVNVRWILEQNPDAKIVLWAHNGHVAEFPWLMGSWLDQWYGEDYLTVGFATGEGRYTARSTATGALEENPLQAPAAGSIESFFRAAGVERGMLDLRASEGDGAAWLHEHRPFRSIGAKAMDEQFYPRVVTQNFDVLIYIDRTNAARQME